MDDPERICDHWGMAPPRKQVLTLEIWMRFVRGDATMRQVCEETGLSKNTVRAASKREGWPQRPETSPMFLPVPPATATATVDVPTIAIDVRLLARNRTESHAQVLRMVMKLRCHLESWVDRETAEGRIIEPEMVKMHGHALAWLERIEADRQRLILIAGKGGERVNLVNEQIYRKPAPPGDPLAIPGPALDDEPVEEPVEA